MKKFLLTVIIAITFIASYGQATKLYYDLFLLPNTRTGVQPKLYFGSFYLSLSGTKLYWNNSQVFTTKDTASADSVGYNFKLLGSPTTPTPTLGANNTVVANTKFVQENNKFFNRMKQLGFDTSCVALPLFSGEMAGAPNNETMVSGRVRGSLFILDETTLVTGIKVNITTPGVYIAKSATGVNGVCLYSYGSGTFTKITTSQTLDTTIWKYNGLRTIPLSTPQTLSPGIYGLFWSWSSSTTTTAPIVPAFSFVNYGGAVTNITANTLQIEFRIDSQSSFGASYLTTSLSGTGYVPCLWFYK